MNRTKIGIVGAAGRMGLEIIRAASKNDQVEVVAGIDHPSHPAQGSDLGALGGIDALGVSLGDTLSSIMGAIDVIVDLSLPKATNSVIEAALGGNKPLVCGTTGISDETFTRLKDAAKIIPVLYTTNLSLGIAVLTSLVGQAIKALGPGYDTEVVEMHHNKKVDAPSGTARSIVEAIAHAKGVDPSKDVIFGRNGHTGARTSDEIGVHAVRGGSVFGDHTVILAGPDERIELSHKAGSRALFALGAIRAAIFISKAKPGMYKMSDVLGL